MSEFKKLASDVSVTFISSITNIIISFPITIIVGRYLGAGDLGLYRLVFSIYTVCMLFATLGVPAALIKYLSESQDEIDNAKKIISSALLLSIVLGILFSIISFILSVPLGIIFKMIELPRLIQIISLAFPFSVVSSTLLAALNGFQYMNKHAIATITQSFLMLFITIISIYFGYGVNGVIASVVVSSIGYFIYLLFALKNYLIIPSLSDFFHYSKIMLSFGIYTVVANSINLINFQADTIMIGYFLTKTDVGYYSIATLFAKLLWLIPDSIQKITYPLISKYHSKKNRELVTQIVTKTMKYNACISVIAGTSMLIYGQTIITLLYGRSFIGSVSPLYILVLGTMIFSIIKCINSLFASIGRMDLFARIPTYSAIINIFLNFLLIPLFQMNGAAVATSISLLIYVLIMLYYMENLINIHLDIWWYAKTTMLFAMLILFNLILKTYMPIYISGTATIILGTVIIWQYLLEPADRRNFLSIIPFDLRSYSNL